MDTNKSTSRRQGLLREEGSEGSRSANVRVPNAFGTDGIVVPGIKDEGPNVEMSGASNELVVGVDSDRRSPESLRGASMESPSLDPISVDVRCTAD